jgi:phospholipid/cholesterol/gamma-HCH transport system substrate-binding protein
MPSYRRNILVGLTVLVAGIVFVVMMLKFGSRTVGIFSPDQTPIVLDAPRSDGLSAGSPVVYLGVGVGRITGVARRVDGAGVTINALVDSKPPLPANLRGEIVQSSAIGGGSSLSLELVGDTPQGQLEAGARLPAAYVGLQLRLLPPEFTQTAKEIGQMSEQIRKTAQQFNDSGAVTHLDQSIQQISKLANSLQSDADQANKQLTDRLTQIAGVLNQMQSISQKINAGNGTAGLLVNDPRLYEALVDSTRELNASVTDLHRLIDQWEQEGVTLHLK